MNNFLGFLSSHPNCHLGNNIISIVGNKLLMIFGMLTHFWIILIPFLHFKPYIFLGFLVPCMFIKKLPIKNKQFVFSFNLVTNFAFDNVQISIYLYTQFNPWEFCNLRLLKLNPWAFCDLRLLKLFGWITIPFLDCWF